MTTNELGAVVIGCGGMGAFTRPATRAALPPGWLPLAHAEALATLEGVRLVGLCDADAAARERAAVHYGVPAFEAAPAMLAALRPDVATIATRTAPRADLLVACVQAGVRGVHAEKPLCRSLADAARVQAAFAAADASFTYGALRRYHAAYRRAAAMLAAGAIGTLRQIVVGFGRRTALWTHTHSIDAMLFFAGGAKALYTQGAVAVDAADVRLDAAPPLVDADPTIEMGYVAFEGGVSGVITQLDGFDVLLAGSAGTLRIAADGTRIDIETADADSGGYLTRRETIPTVADASGTQIALAELAAAVRNGQPERSALAAAIDGQRILFAILLSGLRGGTRMAPGDVPEAFCVTGRSGTLYA